MPFSRGLGREVMYICLSGLVAIFIFYLARPLGFSHLDDFTLIGFGLVSMAAGILYLVITHFLYRQYWVTGNWTIGLEILHSLCLLLFVAAGILIYGGIVGVTALNFKTSLLYFLYTVLLGFLPVVFRALLVRNWRLKKELIEVKRINDLLGNKRAKGGERLIEFPISKKEIFRLTNQSLVYIESKENYVSICWGAGGEIKKQMIRMTLKEAIRQINDPFIVLSHRSFIVNLRRVKEVVSKAGGSEMKFDDVEESVPISGTYKKLIKDKLGDL